MSNDLAWTHCQRIDAFSSLLQYLTSICDQLFPLYRDVEQRPFILQFLPSLIIVYYDVLYHHLPKSTDASIKVKNAMESDHTSLLRSGTIVPVSLSRSVCVRARAELIMG